MNSVCKTQTLGIFFEAKEIVKKMSEAAEAMSRDEANHAANEPDETDSD